MSVNTARLFPSCLFFLLSMLSFVGFADAQTTGLVYQDANLVMGYIESNQTANVSGYDSCFTSVGNYLSVRSDNSANIEPNFRVFAENGTVKITKNAYATGRGTYVCHKSASIITKEVIAGYAPSGTAIGTNLSCVLNIANFTKLRVSSGTVPGSFTCAYSATTGKITASATDAGVVPQCGYVCVSNATNKVSNVKSRSYNVLSGTENIGSNHQCALGTTYFQSECSGLAVSAASYTSSTGIAVKGNSGGCTRSSHSYFCRDTTTPLPTCANGIDDDGDGLIDFPADPGCSSTTDTTETNPTGPACDNGVDDDGDSLIDFPRDPGCSSVTDTSELGTVACDNGLDDDGDALIDFRPGRATTDPGCASVTDTTETNATGPACDNGLDDDGDSLIDFPRDPGCSDVTDTTETNPTGPACDNGVDDDGDSLIDFPRDPGCSSVTDTTETNPTGPACDNGIDDDGDSLIDFPRDPGCSSVTDTTETNPTGPACDNGIDDDGDSLIDFPRDPGCSDVTDTTETNPTGPACDNGVDDDGDSLIDFPRDPGCSGVTDTTETNPTGPACDNGVDDDGDSLIDFPRDPGCSSVTDTTETNPTGPACDNGLDDDGDSLIDFPRDPGCSGVTDTTETNPTGPACDNGLDDDGDSLIDFPRDPGCSGVTDTTETNPNGPDCDNGLDDDGDGLIDVAQDPGCSGPTDTTEEEPLDPLPAPENVQASDGTDPAAVIVTWNASAGATQYQVFRSEVESENGQLIATVSTTSRRDTTASPGIVYFYRIKAINTVNQSAVSDSDSGFRLEPSRLSSPLFTKFNTFLAQSNILELSATGSRGFVKTGSVDNRVRLTLHNLFGRVILTMPISIPAGSQKDLNVNNLVKSACEQRPFLCEEFFDLDANGIVDTYGLVKLEFPDDDSNLALLGRMTNYRSNPDGTFSFAYAKELRNSVRGTTYSVSNTFDPQALGFLVPNWAEIINLDDEEREFTYRLYTQNGTKVIDRKISVRPLGEKDIQAGHEIVDASGRVLESVFLVEVIPESNNFEYFLSVTRFSANAPQNVAPDSFNYAFSLDGRPGNNSTLYSAITNEDRSADCAVVQNWLEVANVREKSINVTVKFRETSVADAGLAASLPVVVSNKGTQTITLRPKSQFHFNASALLEKGTIGVAEVSSNEPGAVVSQSLVYLNHCDRNGVQTAYVTPARQRSSQSSLAGTLNTFLEMSNDVRLSATSSGGISLVFNAQLFGGGASAGIIKLQGFQATSLIAEAAFPLGTPNLDTGTIGTITFDAGASKKGSFVGDVLRVKRATIAGRSRVDFILPTSIR